MAKSLRDKLKEIDRKVHCLECNDDGGGGIQSIQPGANITVDNTDPKNPANSSAAVSTITVQWDGTASNEQKLERIITQKWLAIFPDGQEAWSEYRRTGYPKLFPVANNFSVGTIDTQIGIRRIPFPTSEYGNGNSAEVAKAVGLLGGPDNGGTRLWWDVNKTNF